MTKPKTFRITKSFSKTDDKSREIGDFSETGWEDEEGREFTFNCEGIEEAAQYLECEGVSYFNNWFSTEWAQDYTTGDETQYDFFVKVEPEFPYKKEIEKKLCEQMELRCD